MSVLRVVVFGAGGFLGRAAVRALSAAGHDVVGVGRNVDVRAASAVDAFDAKPNVDVVVNCAARVPKPDDSQRAPDDSTVVDEMLAVNAGGADHVARWAAARGARRVVHTSTLSVIPRPWPVPLSENAPITPPTTIRASSPFPQRSAAVYGATKLAGEVAAAAAHDDVAVLRCSALYGDEMPWHGVLTRFVDIARSGGRPQVASPAACVDLLHVDDAAHAIVCAVAVSAGAAPIGVVNIASGIEASLGYVARAALVACKRGENEFDVGADKTPARALIDIDKAHRVLGFKPRVTLDDGVARLVQWRNTQ